MKELHSRFKHQQKIQNTYSGYDDKQWSRCVNCKLNLHTLCTGKKNHSKKCMCDCQITLRGKRNE